MQSFSVDSVHPMAESPDCTPPGRLFSFGGSTSGLSPDNTGLTLTPLHISHRTCSLNFEKVELGPLSPEKSLGVLKKATSLLALHLLTSSSLRSPKAFSDVSRDISVNLSLTPPVDEASHRHSPELSCISPSIDEIWRSCTTRSTKRIEQHMPEIEKLELNSGVVVHVG